MEITKEPLFVRSIVFGFVIGVAFVLLRRLIGFRYYETELAISLVFCAVLAFISYRYIGVPVFGLVLGAVGVLVYEMVSGLLYGGIPFLGNLQYIQYYPLVLLVAMLLVWIGFPLAGFLGSYMVLRRGGTNLAYMSSEINSLEKKVLEYIKKHNNQIKVSECALELDLNESDVTRVIGSLQEKGLLMQK